METTMAPHNAAQAYARVGLETGVIAANPHGLVLMLFDGGRAFYTALGHLPATYSDAAFMHHVYGGIYWAATGNTFHAE